MSADDDRTLVSIIACDIDTARYAVTSGTWTLEDARDCLVGYQRRLNRLLDGLCGAAWIRNIDSAEDDKRWHRSLGSREWCHVYYEARDALRDVDGALERIDAKLKSTRPDTCPDTCLDPLVCEHRGRYPNGPWTCDRNHPKDGIG